MITDLWLRFKLWLTRTEGVNIPDDASDIDGCGHPDHDTYGCDCDTEAVNYGDWTDEQNEQIGH